MNSLSLHSRNLVLYAGKAPPPSWFVLQFCLSHASVFSPYLLSSGALGWVSIDFRGSTLNACDNPPSIPVCVCVCVFLFHVMYLYIVLCIWVMNRWHARNLYFWDTFSQIFAGSWITIEGGKPEGKEVKSSYLGEGGNTRQIIAKIEFCVLLLEQLWEPGESHPLSSLVLSLPLSNLSKNKKVAVTQYPEELGSHRTSPHDSHQVCKHAKGLLIGK